MIVEGHWTCKKCNTRMDLEDGWAPNDLDQRWYGKCPECGWETDDEFDSYFMPEEEVIVVEADGSRYIHGERYEITFYNEDSGYASVIGTKYSWKGPVEITIRSLASTPIKVKADE